MIQSETLSLGPIKIGPQTFPDERGLFRELYQENRYKNLGIECLFVQDNYSLSLQNTLRGMHFQKTPGQAKLVSVLEGRIFDVIVDIRRESPHFGKWEGVYLDDLEGEQLFIPIGFAHGFCVLSERARVLYKVSSPYDPLEEKTFRFDDPSVAIQWPITKPLLSPKDQQAPYLSELIL